MVEDRKSAEGPSSPEKGRRRVILLGARSPRVAPRQREEFLLPPGKLVRAKARVAAMRRAAEKRRAKRGNEAISSARTLQP